jgi:hypothetical protein
VGSFVVMAIVGLWVLGVLGAARGLMNAAVVNCVGIRDKMELQLGGIVRLRMVGGGR